MIATHKIKKNGRWYYAGEEMDSPALEQTNQEEKAHTKSEINKMSVEDIRVIAMAQGIEGADTMTGTEIKKMLIEKLGLQGDIT